MSEQGKWHKRRTGSQAKQQDHREVEQNKHQMRELEVKSGPMGSMKRSKRNVLPSRGKLCLPGSDGLADGETNKSGEVVRHAKQHDERVGSRRSAGIARQALLIPMCVLMDIFEWQEMHASAQ